MNSLHSKNYKSGSAVLLIIVLVVAAVAGYVMYTKSHEDVPVPASQSMTDSSNSTTDTSSIDTDLKAAGSIDNSSDLKAIDQEYSH